MKSAVFFLVNCAVARSLLVAAFAVAGTSFASAQSPAGSVVARSNPCDTVTS
jgi:hypothetical protein